LRDGQCLLTAGLKQIVQVPILADAGPTIGLLVYLPGGRIRKWSAWLN